MPRRLRGASGGYAYHVLNRAVGKTQIFGRQCDFEAFEEVIREAKDQLPMRILAWCVLSSHWHFVLWPRGDGDLSEFMRSPDGHAHAALARGAWNPPVLARPAGSLSRVDRTRTTNL